MSSLARTMPGYVSHKGFSAEDGERVTVVGFESEAAMRALGNASGTSTAQQKGRESFYEEYTVQVCELVRETRFRRE
jgi:heme-degrading monooxygenase HmoA